MCKEKRYAVPVAEELKGFQIPKDINKFLTKLLPNIYAATYKVCKADREWVVGQFVVYLLSKNSKDILRWKCYNSVKYPNIPYYKWVLSLVKYFVKKHYTNQQNTKEVYTIPIISKQEYQKWCEMAMGCFALESSLSSEEDVFDRVYVKMLPEYLKKYSEAHKKQENLFQKHFENHLYDLYLAKKNGTLHCEFASRVGITNSNVTYWVKKLEALILDYFNGNYVIPA